MSAQVIKIDIFNIAREAYLNNKFEESLMSLDSISSLDTSLIKEEILNRGGNEKYLKSIIDSRAQSIMGVFDCPYHPYLKLEYSRVLDVLPTIDIDFMFGNIRCVKQIESTIGLANAQVVAIFPENFRSIEANEEHPVFYFVDKFASRHLKYTRPMLEKFRLELLFRPLISLSDEKIGGLISNWVCLHEASHRLGTMPIPQYLFEKSNRYTAALEELRADLKTISKCFSLCDNQKSDAFLTGLYVLAERLLAYPLFREKMNFDAISSVIMWKFMNADNVFVEEASIIKIVESIERLLVFITQIENEALLQPAAALRKEKLRSLLVEFLGDYDEEFNNYTRFWSIE